MWFGFNQFLSFSNFRRCDINFIEVRSIIILFEIVLYFSIKYYMEVVSALSYVVLVAHTKFPVQNHFCM